MVPAYLDQFQEEAEKMIEQQLEWDQLQEIAAQLWPLDDEDQEAAYFKQMARKRDLKNLFETAPTQEAVCGTAYAGFKSIVEWVDHVQPAKSKHHRAHKVLPDNGNTQIKRRAFALLSS